MKHVRVKNCGITGLQKKGKQPPGTSLGCNLISCSRRHAEYKRIASLADIFVEHEVVH